MNRKSQPSGRNRKEQTAGSCAKFLEKCWGDVLLQVAKKSRKSINKVVGGKAITEDTVYMKVQDYINEQNIKSKGTPSKAAAP